MPRREYAPLPSHRQTARNFADSGGPLWDWFCRTGDAVGLRHLPECGMDAHAPGLARSTGSHQTRDQRHRTAQRQVTTKMPPRAASRRGGRKNPVGRCAAQRGCLLPSAYFCAISETEGASSGQIPAGGNNRFQIGAVSCRLYTSARVLVVMLPESPCAASERCCALNQTHSKQRAFPGLTSGGIFKEELKKCPKLITDEIP